MSQAGTYDSAPVEFDLRWRYTTHTRHDSHEFLLISNYTQYDDPDVGTLVHDLYWKTPFPDDRAEWHRNYTPLHRWVKAHIYRLVYGWNHKRLHEHLQDNPFVAQSLEFNDDEGVLNTPTPPGYTQLRDIWTETFSDRVRASCEVIAEQLVTLARDNGIPAPSNVFQPEPSLETDGNGEDQPTVRDLTIEKTAEVWEHARPMVLEHWHLKRHHNWQIPEANFFDAHAALAADSDDVFPESGLGNMEAKGTHERVQYPSTHRRELKKFSTEEIRELHQDVTEDLIREARREGELVGEVAVAIDQTKGHPWTGEIERKPDGTNDEDWILGYKNDNDTRVQHYFQWASVQIVGLDVPLILDAIPVERGMSKAEIVDTLLSTATEMVDDIDVVMMDAGFDSEGAKNVVEKHEIRYLNRGHRSRDDKRRMRKMWEDGDVLRVEEGEDRGGMPVRKRVFVPKVFVEEDLRDEEGGEERTPTGANTEQSGIGEFGTDDEDDVGEDDEDAEAEAEEDVETPWLDDGPVDNLMAEMEERLERPDEDEGDDDEDDGEDDLEEYDEPDDEAQFDPASAYVIFETNHDLVDTGNRRGEDEVSRREQLQAAARLVRWYGNRWGIENGYKKVGHFLPRSGSPDHTLRFFGFMFACTLYNCWRLVDLLVKLSVEDDPAYTPLVTASRFLAVAEGMFGLGSKPPPD